MNECYNLHVSLVLIKNHEENEVAQFDGLPSNLVEQLFYVPLQTYPSDFYTNWRIIHGVKRVGVDFDPYILFSGSLSVVDLDENIAGFVYKVEEPRNEKNMLTLLTASLNGQFGINSMVELLL
jgi:hypothetical protein